MTARSLHKTTLLFVLVSFVGCGKVETQKSDSPLTIDLDNPALPQLIEHYDGKFDPSENMVLEEFATPGYHSRIPAGTLTHPTRESLIYALALYEQGEPTDVDRASRIVARVLRLQNADPESPTYGVWPWLLEEPLGEMAAPDLNWADFCGISLCQILVRHSNKLEAGLCRDIQQSVRHAASAIERRDVDPGYTNIAVLGGVVCTTAGELLGDPSILEYGRQRLLGIVDHVEQHSTFNEYNSPPYVRVVIAECERALMLIRDAEARGAAEHLRRAAWKLVAESFHPSTQQIAGPHARTSRIRLRKSEVEFLSRRLDAQLKSHSTMDHGKPPVFAVIRPLRCPVDLAGAFSKSNEKPEQLRRTFIRRDARGQSTVGTTWFAPDACLGSVNRSTFWTQRKPIIGCWRTDTDMAVVFRVRFLHDGRDFASMGVRTAQEGPRVLCMLQPVENRGDWHRSLDRPANGVFRAADLRVRFELNGNDAATSLIGDGRYSLLAGQRKVVIHTLPSQFAGREIEWEIGRDKESVFLDGVFYDGAPKQFRFDENLKVRFVAGMELLPIDEDTETQKPIVIGSRSMISESSWNVGPETTLTLRNQTSMN